MSLDLEWNRVRVATHVDQVTLRAARPPQLTGRARRNSMLTMLAIGSRRLACVGIAVAIAMAAACSSDGGDARDSLPRLAAAGRDIVDPAGQVVKLRGVNLGSWLFHENWISNVDYPLHGRIHVLAPESGIASEADAALREVGPSGADGWLDRFRGALAARVDTERSDTFLAEVAQYPVVFDDSDQRMRALLEERFGIDGRDELLDVFWGSWIREPDIAWVASQGFNVVRVPMTYRSLVVASDRSVPDSLVWNEAAFRRIDELLSWCDRHGVYAVLDLQESIGGHNDYAGPPELYTDPRDQELTIALWEEIARRYARRSVVAAYSLLAEPFGAPDAAARDAMYDRLVKAIRARGDDHLLVIHDGFFGVWTLPQPEAFGWTGVVYSTHLFEFGVENALEYQLLFALYDVLFNQAQARQQVPYYIGSFSTFQDADFAYRGAELATQLFNRSGWSWSVWTLKRIDDPIDQELFGTTTSWGVLGRLESVLDRPDLYRDSFETLSRKLAAYADLALAPNERLRAILANAAHAP
ncbi:MAG: cellulase family glycosylhydrolase [bacterium]